MTDGWEADLKKGGGGRCKEEKTREQAERERPEAHAFIRSTSEVCLGSWAKTGLVNSNQKECGFGSLLQGSYLSGV